MDYNKYYIDNVLNNLVFGQVIRAFSLDTINRSREKRNKCNFVVVGTMDDKIIGIPIIAVSKGNSTIPVVDPYNSVNQKVYLYYTKARLIYSDSFIKATEYVLDQYYLDKLQKLIDTNRIPYVNNDISNRHGMR